MGTSPALRSQLPRTGRSLSEPRVARRLSQDEPARPSRGACDRLQLIRNVPTGLNPAAQAHDILLMATLELDDKRGLEDGVQLVLPRVGRADHEFRLAG